MATLKSCIYPHSSAGRKSEAEREPDARGCEGGSGAAGSEHSGRGERVNACWRDSRGRGCLDTAGRDAKRSCIDLYVGGAAGSGRGSGRGSIDTGWRDSSGADCLDTTGRDSKRADVDAADCPEVPVRRLLFDSRQGIQVFKILLPWTAEALARKEVRGSFFKHPEQCFESIVDKQRRNMRCMELERSECGCEVTENSKEQYT